jgi:hypothetical protein
VIGEEDEEEQTPVFPIPNAQNKDRFKLIKMVEWFDAATAARAKSMHR